MIKLIYGLLLVAMPSAAMAQTTTLWNNLTLGMPEADVKALYPYKIFPEKPARINLTEGCIVQVNTLFANKGLKEVQLEGDWYKSTAKGCKATVLQSLVNKYGEPGDEFQKTKGSSTSRTNCYGKKKGVSCYSSAEGPELRSYKVWHTEEGVEITWRTTDEDKHAYRISYKMIPVGSEEAESKL